MDLVSCKRCGEIKSKVAFTKVKNPRICLACRKEKDKKWQQKFYQENREKILAQERLKYGAFDYEDLMARQNGICAICRRPHSGSERRLVIDHNHETGKIRGLLCYRCNNGLGMFADDPLMMQSAVAYVERDGA